MQKVNNFSPSHARIGLDRIFLKSPQLDPNKDVECDEKDKFENETISDPSFIENLLTQNSQKLSKYKNEGCVCIYDEKIFDFPKTKILFNNLLDILENDYNSEIILDKYKGKWIDSINQMIGIENLKSFSENLFKFDPLYPINFQFESRFESGNLRMAIKVNDYEFDLIVNNDTNSGKASNWFYFRVTLRNTGRVNISENPIKYKFNIINCQKPDTLFSKGLKVLCYSATDKKWNRRTKNNYYYLNGLTIEDKKLYTLTFTFEVNYNFTEENLYFAYCFPYTYTNLQNYLSSILNNPIISQKNILRHEIIGKSLSENNLDMVIITKFDSNFDDIAYRPCVILSSRVHPGESNSSYVIQGVIDFLLDLKNPVAEKLRKSYIFKIIPMLNPDGVINGNFRTSLVGKDLNRLWDDPKENFCPTIYFTKEMIKKTILSREVYLFCDFHGHSNKPNFFLYGCPTSRKLRTQMNLTYQEMVLSRIYSTKNDVFDHKSCIYKIIIKKLKTARAVVKNELNIDFSYCLESSIGYISIGENKLSFFTPKSYAKIGIDFCLSLNDFTNKEIFSESLQKVQAEESARIILNNSNTGNNNNSNVNVTSNSNFNSYNNSNTNFISNFNYNINIQSQHVNSSNMFHTPVANTNNLLIANKIGNGGIITNKYNNGNISSNGNYITNPNSCQFNSTFHSHANSVSGVQIDNKKSNQNEEFKRKEVKELKDFNSKIRNKDKDKEIFSKENKCMKEKEGDLFNKISVNKDKNLNKKENGKFTRNKIPKNNSENSLADENKVEKFKSLKMKEKERGNITNISEKDPNGNFGDNFNLIEKKIKKQKKKLTPIKSKKISKLASVENQNNTSNSNNLNSTNNGNSSTSFINANSTNTTTALNNPALINVNIANNSKIHMTPIHLIMEKNTNIKNFNTPNFKNEEEIDKNFISKNSTNKLHHYSFSCTKSSNNTIGNNISSKNNLFTSKTPVDSNVSEGYLNKVKIFSNSKKSFNRSREKEKSTLKNEPNELRISIIYSDKPQKNNTLGLLNNQKNEMKYNNSLKNFNKKNTNDSNLKNDREREGDKEEKLNFENEYPKVDFMSNCYYSKNSRQHSQNNNQFFSQNAINPLVSFTGGSKTNSSFNQRMSVNEGNFTGNNVIFSNQDQKIIQRNIYNDKFQSENYEFLKSKKQSTKTMSNKNLNFSKIYDKIDLKIINKGVNSLTATVEMDKIDISNSKNNNKNIIGSVFNYTSYSGMESEKPNKSKSINNKIVDPSKIYLTPTQKIYKSLNENHVLFTKYYINKNK